MTVELIVDNSDMSIRDTGHALWREGRDPVAIAYALIDGRLYFCSYAAPVAASGASDDR